MAQNNTAAQAPKHLGLILDGNRRWAKAQNLPTLEGHKKGYENLKKVATYAFNHGVDYVSAYVFSTENWHREREEVEYLMKLLLWVATHEIKELDKNNIKVVFLGGQEKLSKKVLTAMRKAEDKTATNDGGVLALCLNYGGHQEVVSAVNSILKQQSTPSAITEEQIAAHLFYPEIPAVDLVIRTSGEQRISNFMLWRSAYSELYFCDDLWPDFDEQSLQKALDIYATRHRRFGK